jgi:hypothetical protein
MRCSICDHRYSGRWVRWTGLTRVIDRECEGWPKDGYLIGCLWCLRRLGAW